MKKEKKVKSEILEWIIMLATAVVLAFLIKTFILSVTLVQGPSMEPTLRTGDKLLVNRVGFMVDDLEYGNIIEFHSPEDENVDFIKRVIAVEGDTVEIIDSKVYVNGKQLTEEYTSTNGETEFFTDSYWEIKKGEVFVLGDNRPNSNDSRSFGPINKDSIVGRAFFRAFPLKKFGKI